jgi:hypothetical protein
MRKKAILLYLTVIFFYVTSPQMIDARILEVPWKTLLVVNNLDDSVQTDLFRLFLRDIRSSLQKSEYFDLYEEKGAFSGKKGFPNEQLISYSLKQGYEVIVIITINMEAKKNTEAVGTEGMDQYLIRKSIPVYTIEGRIYFAENKSLTKVYSEKVKREQIDKARQDMVQSINKIIGGKKKTVQLDHLVEEIDEAPKKVVPIKELEMKSFEEKKTFVPKSLAKHQYYVNGGMGTLIPGGLYSQYASYGLGIVLEIGMENPKIKNHYFGAELGGYYIRPKRETMDSYKLFSMSIGTSYLYPVHRLFAVGPSFSLGYLAHRVSSRMYFDPQIIGAIRGIYSIQNNGALFCEFAHKWFFEKNHNGRYMQANVGYQWRGEFLW